MTRTTDLWAPDITRLSDLPAMSSDRSVLPYMKERGRSMGSTRAFRS